MEAQLYLLGNDCLTIDEEFGYMASRRLVKLHLHHWSVWWMVITESLHFQAVVVFHGSVHVAHHASGFLLFQDIPQYFW